MKKSHTLKLIIIVSTLLICSFLSLSIFNYIAMKDSIKEEIVNSTLPLLRDNINSQIQKNFIPSLHHASLMANDSYVKNWITSGEKDINAIREYLLGIHEEYGYFSTFLISEKTHAYYHYDGILKTVNPKDPHDIWYYTFIKSGEKYDLDVDTNEAADNQLTIFINHRIEDTQGNLLGVIGVGIKMKHFSSFLEEKQRTYSRNIYLVDPDGIIQAHSEEKMIEHASIFDQAGIKDIADDMLIPELEPRNNSYRNNGHSILTTSLYMPELDWFLVVEQDEKESLGIARKNLLRTIIIGLVTSLIITSIIAVIIRHFQKKLEYNALTDELTQIANRRNFIQQMHISISRFRRYSLPLSLILFDIDHFKQINDAQGHLNGDQILKDLAAFLQSIIRDVDFAARWGGDEFVIIVHNKQHETERLAERIRKELRNNPLPMGSKEADLITLSMGVTEFTKDDTLEKVMGRADKALYTAKDEGRDKIIVLS
ncbi:MAG: sensor domain-containing diguanylate cyclase [Spirochaetia bacterium]|nr:sensor domain-containing diguanylate cyclase [Spirochaetia bacterium]MCF7952568.1 sensor domain-containing diguanylate cyclase [Spirochaetales bacterium]